jgi:hypothetical protein
MSSDIVTFIDSATEVIGIVIYLFAVFRAITIGRALVNRIYRDRAYFVGALIVFLLAQSFVPDNLVFLGFYLYQVTYFALAFFIIVLIDNTILVGLDMDFFHRNTLRWRQTRLVVYPIFIIVVVSLLFALSGYLPVSHSGGILVIGSFVFIFTYAAATLVVTAHRTPDRPMRKFLMYAGVLIVGFLVSTLINNYTNIDAVDVFDDLLGVGLAYVNYLMVMSLSPMSKIKKESDQVVS